MLRYSESCCYAIGNEAFLAGVLIQNDRVRRDADALILSTLP